MMVTNFRFPVVVVVEVSNLILHVLICVVVMTNLRLSVMVSVVAVVVTVVAVVPDEGVPVGGGRVGRREHSLHDLIVTHSVSLVRAAVALYKDQVILELQFTKES